MSNLFLTLGSAARLFYNIMLGLDGAIYWCIDIFYSVFLTLCNAKLFDTSTYAEFSSRIYSILGIVMLFVVSFQILTMVADPNKATSGDAPASKIAMQIVITIVILTLLPTAFKYLYRFQQVVVSENIVGNIILGSDTYPDDATKDQLLTTAGKQVSLSIYEAFLYPKGYEGAVTTGCDAGLTPEFCKEYTRIHEINSVFYGKISLYNQKFIRNEIDREELQYQFILSAIAGGFVVYLLISFCIDMGVRVAKLAYFQLIAPIPVAMRIIPKQSKVFDNWLNGLIKTYLDLFLRLMIIFFCVYLITLVPEAITNLWASRDGTDARLIVKVFTEAALIFGILLFMKSAPKLLSELFGLSDASMKLGIKDKLKDMALIGEGGALSAKKFQERDQKFQNWRARQYKNKALKEQNKLDNGSVLGRNAEVRRANRGQESLLDEHLRKANIEPRKKNAESALGAYNKVMDTAKSIVLNENSTVKSAEGHTYIELQTMVSKAKSKEEALAIRSEMSRMVSKESLAKVAADNPENIAIKTAMDDLQHMASQGKIENFTGNVDFGSLCDVKTAAETASLTVHQEERAIHDKYAADAAYGQNYKGKPKGK